MEIKSHKAATVKYVGGILDTFHNLRKKKLLYHLVQLINLTETLLQGCKPNPPIKAYPLKSTRC